jgi:type VI protein secretion system component Hcp
MPVSKATSRLLLYGASGLKISRAVLTVRIAGKDQDFLKWILTDSQIVSYQSVANTHGDGLSDQITLIPGKVEVEYREPLSNGSLGDTVRAGWDMRTGKSVQ